MSESLPLRRGLVTSLVLLAYLLLLADAARVFWAAVGVAVLGVALGAWFRRIDDPMFRGAAPVMPLVALGGIAVLLPATAVNGLLAGVGAIVLLVWMADDPRRLPGGPGRAAPTVTIAGLAMALAWGSATLLPTRSAPLGVAAALIVAVVALVSVLIARPELIGSEEAATS